MTTPCVKLSDFGILGLENDLAMMTDCQYGGCRLVLRNFMSSMNSMHIVKLHDLVCATDVDLSNCTLHSGHLEQLAIACPNLQRLNLNNSSFFLESLQGLQAIASHCHHLQGLDIGNIHLSYDLSKLENHILL